MITVYKVKGYSMDIYCKVSKFPQYGGGFKNTISFGGKNSFCLVSKISDDKPSVCYIDRVERNSACVIDGTLEEKGGTEILVKIALWTIKQLFPEVKRFTLQDDSNILCEKNGKIHKISLGFDYIIKYNQTWYQSKFNAKLPNVAIHLDDMPINDEFNNSLKILDQPLQKFDTIPLTNSLFISTKEIYNSSSTPRNYINNLRSVYGNNYCFMVSEWFSHYMGYLGIKLHQDLWYIDADSIEEPDKFTIQETKNTVRGGFRRKTIKKRNFRLVAGGDGSIVI